MTTARRGSIVLVASIVGLESASAPLPYSAAKAALVNYGKNLARQLGPSNVRVNSVAPGNILFPGGSWEAHLAERRDEVLQQVEAEVPLQRFRSPRRDSPTSSCSCHPTVPRSSPVHPSLPMADRRGAYERPMRVEVESLFDLTGRVAVITGGSGLLGYKHAEAIAAVGGTPVLVDLAQTKPAAKAARLASTHGVETLGCVARHHRRRSSQGLLSNSPRAVRQGRHPDKQRGEQPQGRGQHGPCVVATRGLSARCLGGGHRGRIDGTFLCSQIIGSEMARRKKGVILEHRVRSRRHRSRPAPLSAAGHASRSTARQARDLLGRQDRAPRA